MARVLKAIDILSSVEITVDGQEISVKGSKGTMQHTVHEDVEIHQEDGTMRFSPRKEGPSSLAQVGTARALVGNMMVGVSEGFERRLALEGVGYRAQAQGANLNLTLGFSHPVDYPVPEGVTVETPSNTEIVVKGMDKQKVGQVAAEIRSFRPPEPYKGKGVRYSDERVVRKEAKKK